MQVFAWEILARGKSEVWNLPLEVFNPADLDFRCCSTQGHKAVDDFCHMVSTLPFSHIESSQKVEHSQLVPGTHHNYHLLLCFFSNEFSQKLNVQLLNMSSSFSPPCCLCLISPPLQLTGVPWFIPHSPPPPPLAVQVERLLCAFFFFSPASRHISAIQNKSPGKVHSASH